ncbi:MAG: bifunctional (p)ppGpp synthetase/guanosine-3',5'-bis(diphosphate) 3'-pyrophosphohydrolase [Muribaculaceae bacterium]|nr:bifunctional (p)ppGpp synthetase/guanosine-3',5'-bis(diphosphate) 3'-pyrophosphohydrolase [Muribaculaceae bacterium]
MEQDYNAIIDQKVADMIDAIKRRIEPEDIKRIKDAFELAREAHKKQFRKSGEPYILHPIAVARIVAEELELGANPIIAAFLHDVVEDTDYTLDDIRKRFGDDVAFLVGVVTKKKKDRYERSKQVDNYQQILESVQFDVRALLIKLADRLHNMRTLDSMRPDKQMKIAGETDYFYAPLANRLGLYHVKSELENLSFRYRCPQEYAEIEALLAEEKESIKEMTKTFLSRISEVFTREGIKARTEMRFRPPFSIWRKMKNKGCDFSHVTGKHYIRIIYPNMTQLSEKDMSLRIYSVLTDVFKERPGSVANYINAPKENGYQSFHVKLLSPRGKWEEIHISSERMVRNSRLGCTAERSEKNIKAWLDKFRESLKDIAHHSNEIDFMEGVTSSFYNDDIMVFTPKGKAIILPKNATALDFAYEIHSQVGQHAKYARINGRLSSVKTVLQRGDCIEIGTNEKVNPKPDWLDHVLTYKAKKQIRTFLSHQKRVKYILCPNCHPIPGEEVIGFKSSRGEVTLHKRNCKSAISMASQQGDSIVAVNFEEDPEFLYPVRLMIRGIDRYHLLSDLVDCITERQRLSMTELSTNTIDNIAECTIDFAIHSVKELNETIESINAIDGIDEVYRVEIN